MNNIRIVKDEIGNIYLSQEDLLGIMAERMERFPDELEELRKPHQSKVISPNGQPVIKPSDPKEVAHHEGMQKMLEGLMNIINITDEDE